MTDHERIVRLELLVAELAVLLSNFIGVANAERIVKQIGGEE